MNPSSLARPSTISHHSFSQWFRWCSIATLIASVALFYVSLFARTYHAIIATNLVPSLVVALSFAVLLNVYTLWYLRREHKQADEAFRYTDVEFSSIYQNVLDGILIVDSAGTCLDANPAAATILRCTSTEVVGLNITRFFFDPTSFNKRWNTFLREGTSRGRARLMAGDGADLFVDFKAVADYLPGRHVLVICDVTERTQAEISLRESEARFQEMASHIAEIFWRMDAQTQEVVYVNSAYATITGHSVESLRENPASYRELIHPEDRVRIISRLQETISAGTFDEEFRFTRADGIVRWIWAKGFPVPSNGETRWLVGTAQDITSRKQAEMKISEQLDTVEAARAEAEALRKSTLALSQNLSMDSVLDTLLNCIRELVPFDRAAVLFVEEGWELLIAREVPRVVPDRTILTIPRQLCPLFKKLLFDRKATLVPDLTTELGSATTKVLYGLRAWLGVPLLAEGRVLGILSLGSTVPGTFTTEHLRLAKSLAVSAVVAIQNARTHERAEIYASELEVQLKARGADSAKNRAFEG
jgi:PAS domain S-box-containing protein